jgi:hypothetical protein
MTRTTLTALAFFFCASCALAATPSKAEVLNAIAVMERNVTSPEAPVAAKTIVVYAQLSDDVMVDIGQEQLPWVAEQWNLGPDKERTCQSLLMAAFVAGNIKSQLKAEKAEDDTYSGWIFAIYTYRQLKEHFDFRSPAIEDLIKMQADGKLRDHARQVQAEEEQQDEADNAPKPLA